MVVIEIPENPNCSAVELRVFHDLEPPRPVIGVRLQRGSGETSWHDVTGWTLAGQPCPALAQKVDDSGEGVAYLVRGGDAGLRVRPAGVPRQARDAGPECSRGTGVPRPWRLDSPGQHGEPFLLIADPVDLRFAPA